MCVPPFKIAFYHLGAMVHIETNCYNTSRSCVCMNCIFFLIKKFFISKKHTLTNCKKCCMYLILMSFCWYKNKLAKVEADSRQRVYYHTAWNKFENMPTLNQIQNKINLYDFTHQLFYV